jgi:succinyl-CoA synthetase beta subunit
MDIEEVAATQPNQVLRKTVDIAYGFHPFEARKMAFVTGLKAKTAQQLAEILLALYNLYWEKDAELVEINPLVLTGSGSWVCVDGKMNIDNNALFRHPDLKALREDTLETRLAEGGPRERLIYVPLEGNIGIMGTGAGMTMATMDQVIAAGGRPASFIDCGSSMRYVGPEKGIKLLKEKGVDVILISTYTGGRSQMAAKRICEVLESMPDFEIPVVVRLQGKNEGEAIETLSSCKHPALKVAKDPDEAVRIAVAIARERERK